MTEIKVVLDEGAYMPERAHKEDAGFDLRTRNGFTLQPGSTEVIDTGIHIAIPKGYFGKLESKSGLNVKHGIVSCGGVIDCGYTGSIKVKLCNSGRNKYTFNPGDKIVQLIIIPCDVESSLSIVESLRETDRGEKGFGSTGR